MIYCKLNTKGEDVWQIDQMGLILQTIFQKRSLLKLIPEGVFFFKAFRQGGWRNTIGMRHVTDSPMLLARQDSARLTGDIVGTRDNRYSVFCYYEWRNTFGTKN